MEKNDNNQRQINKDLQELIHLSHALKSLANVLNIRVDNIIVREGNRKRNGDDNKEEED